MGRVPAPLLDGIRLLDVSETTVDVVADADEAAACVVHLFLVRHRRVRVVQLLEGLLHWTHPLFALRGGGGGRSTLTHVIEAGQHQHM